MKLGDQIESAMWMDGTETELQVQTHHAHVAAAISVLCYEQGWECGPTTFTEKQPGDECVPQVPDHISGPKVRLLVAEATVTGKKVETKPDSFVANLDRKDLARLRKMTRVAHAKHMPSNGVLSDTQCDEIIEQLGPEAALDTLRRRDTLH